jgi:hypothetical protein
MADTVTKENKALKDEQQKYMSLFLFLRSSSPPFSFSNHLLCCVACVVHVRVLVLRLQR